MSFCTKDFCKHCICFKPKVFKLDPDNHTVLDSFVPDQKKGQALINSPFILKRISFLIVF